MILELTNIHKSYENKAAQTTQKVLSGINLTLAQGDCISVVGPSGSGKSTLLNIIGTLEKPSSGQVKFDDTDIVSLNNQQLAKLRNKKIGFVFQAHHLLPQLNVLENILLPTIAFKSKTDYAQAQNRALQWLEQVGLAEKTYQFPNILSGGESQKVAVIRALINQPELILADEPTGSLDAASATIIGDLLAQINQTEKVSLILVTHSERLAQQIGHIHLLSDGQLISSPK